MAGNSTESGRSVTSKITSILMTFTEGTEHTLTEIAGRAGLPISTAHRLTSELASLRLLERTQTGQYRAGLSLRMMGTAPPQPPSVAERACFVLEDLSSATRRPTRLGVLAGVRVAYIEKRVGPLPATTFDGSATLPAHATAVGKALLAFSPARTVESVVSHGLVAYTKQTIAAADQLAKSLAVTRLTMVATSRREFEADLCGVAMPVFGGGGQIVAAIEVAMSDLGPELPAVLAALSIATRSLSRELSGRSPSLSPVPRRDPQALVSRRGLTNAGAGPAGAEREGQGLVATG